MQALRDPSGITSRQRQVVELIAQGLSNDEVGVALGISPRTAKAHCDVLRQKLGVPRRRQIPIAFRLLTGEDPLANTLAVGASRRRGLTAKRRPRRSPSAADAQPLLKSQDGGITVGVGEQHPGERACSASAEHGTIERRPPRAANHRAPAADQAPRRDRGSGRSCFWRPPATARRPSLGSGPKR